MQPTKWLAGEVGFDSVSKSWCLPGFPKMTKVVISLYLCAVTRWETDGHRDKTAPGWHHPCPTCPVMLRALQNLPLRGEDVEGGLCPTTVPRSPSASLSTPVIIIFFNISWICFCCVPGALPHNCTLQRSL